jgi:UDP-GlcNAc3NAcA epimerase
MNMTEVSSSGQPEVIKIVTVVGARPQFIKAAMVSQAIESHNLNNHKPEAKEIIVHTGQHYDKNMSQVFFDELEIPQPQYNLGIGSGSHGKMTGAMIAEIEDVLLKEVPNYVLVYGDTNSTLAGALAAVKLHIPVAHVEAGLRSYNRRMPEEINRVLTDQIATILFCPTSTSVQNLEKEGIFKKVFQVGDVMYDAFLNFKNMAQKKSTILKDLGITRKSYNLATIHRQENTDDAGRLKIIFDTFQTIASAECPLIVPIHPRTKKAIGQSGCLKDAKDYVRFIPPVSYLDAVALEVNARVILTDSGGIQKEAFFAKVPCVTLREETEWVETIQAGWNYLGGAATRRIIEAFNKANSVDVSNNVYPYGNGDASQLILNRLISDFGGKELD